MIAPVRKLTKCTPSHAAQEIGCRLSVAGSGAAEKDAVARGVSTLTGGRYEAGDATDALAVAICHVRHASFARRLRPAEA